MARLSVFHMLCPLIDQSSFVGVANDCLENCVIVTLGRNIVIRYKIVDRKQVGSWSTREKLTSPVIYDPIGCQYVAVFNRNQIRTWKQEDDDLDAIKKNKFSEEIQCVLACADNKVEPVVLFHSGRICRLSRLLKNREKMLDVWKQQERNGLNQVLKTDEKLEEWHMFSCQTETNVFLSARSLRANKHLNFYLLTLSCKEDEEYRIIKRFSLRLPEAHLVGHTVIQRSGDSSLVTLWSNGKIYILSLGAQKNSRTGESNKYTSEQLRGEEMGPGRIIDSVKGLVDVEYAVALVALGSDHLALYGAEPGSSGGVVYIVDFHTSATGDLPWEVLKESAAKQCLKNFNEKDTSLRIWKAAGYLFIPSVDGRLLLASYELGPHPPLSDLLGCLWKHTISKKAISNKNNGIINHHNQLQHVNWLSNNVHSALNCIMPPISVKEKAVEEGNKTCKKENTPENVSLKLKPLIKEGLPESSICSMILPFLVKEGDIESISWCLSHFRDIPENNLVDLLCFFLNQKSVKISPKKVDLVSTGVDEKSLNTSVCLKSSKEKLPASETSSAKVVMNGDIHESMDTDTCDSYNESNDKFEVGHTFVKGRRRSLRVMKVATPQKQPPTPKVVGSPKKVKKVEMHASQDVFDMDIDSCSSECVSTIKKRGRKDSSQVLNGLEAVKEAKGDDDDDNDNRVRGGGELNGIEEDGSSLVDFNREEEDCAKRTPKDDPLVKPMEKPILIEEERKMEGLVLPVEQLQQVGMILSLPVSSMILMPQLRAHLPFSLALKLLKHLIWLLSYPPMSPLSSSPTETQVIHWICHLLDAFYQRFTLSQDIEVKETLNAIREALDMQLQLIDSLKEIAPIILQLKSGKKEEENTTDKWYSIENIRLY